MDELVIGDKTYIPSRKAAEITGYAKDYVGQLCREGRVEAKLVGRSWYVLEESIREHRFGGSSDTAETAEEAPQEPQAEVVEEENETVVQEWEAPKYVSEEIQEIVPIDKTTYVENKPSFTSTPSVETIQSSWESWFSHNKKEEMISTHENSSFAEDTDTDTADAFPLEKVEENQSFNDNYPTEDESSVESEEHVLPIRKIVTQEAYIPPQSHMERREVKATHNKRKTRRKGNIVLQAVFVSFVIVIATMVAIGSGVLKIKDSDSQFAAPLIHFLSGTEKISK